MKKILITLMMSLAVLGVGVQPVYAGGGGGSCDTGGFLGIRPWYALVVEGDCKVKQPTKDELPKFVWSIGLIILQDLFMIVGYAAIGFMIYGGWWYLRSEGDPNNVAKGKKILMSAAIGAAIALLATVIVNTIIAVLGS